ncbi:LexA repressor [Capsulimonas corticalis]|uniref:LexA repressor n=1 Tax=Capsulimonas corticalis TaxID=2219043 RepID=A0A402CTW5_9BACT|nr:transcriptional repressor LexA [Capsulimonas corticalis]BDI28758.1 LexA repressor [Capsulimonas corticalis]
MAKGLTDRQQEVFNFIVAFVEEKGYPPTIREMQLGLNIGSLRGVTIHLDALHKKGFIERLSSKNGPRTSRGIRILARVSERSADEVSGMVRLPLIGTIAAGTPLLATQNIEDIVPVPLQLLKSSQQECFLLRVQGESMTGAHILPGDLVIIQPQITAENGDIVAARIGEEATVKRFRRHGNRIELQAQNPNYAPIPLRKSDNAAIIGKVVGLLRGYIG